MSLLGAAPVALDATDVVETVDRKIKSLEACALRRLAPGASLPASHAPRTFPSVRALYNAVDSILLKLERAADALPVAAREGRSHLHASLIDYDPGEAFYKRVEPALVQVIGAAARIAATAQDLGARPVGAIILSQARLLGDCARAEATLVSRASKMAKPGDPVVLKRECEPLVDASAEVVDLKYEANVRSPLHGHVMALADAAAALGWVVAPAPLKHVRDYQGIITTQTESILASYIDLGCNAAHSDFAEALNAVTEALVDYVTKEHPAGLRWNYGQGATPLGYRRADRKQSADAHPFGDFYRLIHSGVARYYSCSVELGGAVAKQARALVDAYTELATVIEAASSKVQPPGDGAGELRMLLMSVQHELNAFEAVKKETPANYKYMDHVNVMTEFVTVMQWCTATINKMSPVSFIIDVEAVTNLYLDKLVISHAGPTMPNEPYATTLHREWASTVHQMMAELREYVKSHHINGLMFDTRRTRKSMDALARQSSLSSQLQKLHADSKSSEWKRGKCSLFRDGRVSHFDGWVCSKRCRD